MNRVVPCFGVLLAVGMAASAWAAPQPGVPRNGQHSVQGMFGGTNKIPLCIVPPRQYADGTEIPGDKDCAIVVFRSVEKGRPGTYTQEVGRGIGKVRDDLEPWVNVSATVPADSPDGGTIYLASCALIDGEWSDLNNQWLTIVWAPGQFDVVEYPEGGSNPGPPPGVKRGPRVVGLTESFASPLGEPGHDYVAELEIALGIASMPRFKELFEQHIVGTISLMVGEYVQIKMGPPTRRVLTDGTKVPLPDPTTWLGDPHYEVQPGGIVEMKDFGATIGLKALKEGVAAVLAYRDTKAKGAEGEYDVVQRNVWIILVGQKATDDYKQGQGKPLPPRGPGLKSVTVTGRCVRVEDKAPVAGALISLIDAQGTVYYPEDFEKWKSGADGTFTITASAETLKRSDGSGAAGIPAGEYEVMAQWRPAGGGADLPTVENDLWPINRYMIKVTEKAAGKGPFPVGDIEMRAVKYLDLNKRPKVYPGGPLKTSIAFLVDTSGSMDGRKMESAKQAVKDAVAKTDDGQTEWALISFGNCEVAVECGFTQEPTEIGQAVDGLSAQGDTPLTYARNLALTYLAEKGQGTEGRLVLLCDGQDNCPEHGSAASGEAAATLRQLMTTSTTVRLQGGGS